MTQQETKQLVDLAIGRIFRIMSRPFKSGDLEEYERCRKIVMDHVEVTEDYQVSYARDRLKGAQGD